MPIQPATESRRGLTLVESSIAVSAVVILLFIAASRVSGEGPARNERLAQVTAERLAAAFQAGKTAGIHSFCESEEGPRASVAEVVQAVAAGSIAQTGTFQGKFFGVPGLPEQSYLAAQRYLAWDRDLQVLRYCPRGPGAPP